MSVIQIPFKKTGFFSKTMIDYLEESEKIKPFYNNFSNIEGLKKQVEAKGVSFKPEKRTVLVNALKKQYSKLNATEETIQNIDSLLLENTYTITTGHQLNLFTGPLYFFV